jgi:hypothetical protein
VPEQMREAPYSAKPLPSVIYDIYTFSMTLRKRSHLCIRLSHLNNFLTFVPRENSIDRAVYFRYLTLADCGLIALFADC